MKRPCEFAYCRSVNADRALWSATSGFQALSGVILENSGRVIEIAGKISDRDAVRAETLVVKHVKVLRKEWAKIHGEQRTRRN